MTAAVEPAESVSDLRTCVLVELASASRLVKMSNAAVTVVVQLQILRLLVPVSVFVPASAIAALHLKQLRLPCSSS